MKVLMMTLMYLSLVIIHQVGARVVPMTHVKTFNSMHRLASFAFIPPTAEESLGETVRFFQNSCIILYYFFTFFFLYAQTHSFYLLLVFFLFPCGVVLFLLLFILFVLVLYYSLHFTCGKE